MTVWTPFYQTFDLITVGVVALVRLGTALANRNGGQLSRETKFWYTGHMVTLFVGTQVGVGTTLSSRDRGQVTIGTILEGTVHLSTPDNDVKTVEGIWTTLTHGYRSYRTILTSLYLTSHSVTVVSGTKEGTWTTSSLWCWRNVSIGTKFCQTSNGRTVSGSKCRISLDDGILWTLIYIRTASISWSQASILAEFILTIYVGTKTVPSPGFCDCS